MPSGRVENRVTTARQACVKERVSFNQPGKIKACRLDSSRTDRLATCDDTLTATPRHTAHAVITLTSVTMHHSSHDTRVPRLQRCKLHAVPGSRPRASVPPVSGPLAWRPAVGTVGTFNAIAAIGTCEGWGRHFNLLLYIDHRTVGAQERRRLQRAPRDAR
jgi:hypothetical protein